MHFTGLWMAVVKTLTLLFRCLPNAMLWASAESCSPQKHEKGPENSFSWKNEKQNLPLERAQAKKGTEISAGILNITHISKENVCIVLCYVVTQLCMYAFSNAKATI